MISAEGTPAEAIRFSAGEEERTETMEEGSEDRWEIWERESLRKKLWGKQNPKPTDRKEGKFGNSKENVIGKQRISFGGAKNGREKEKRE